MRAMSGEVRIGMSAPEYWRSLAHKLPIRDVERVVYESHPHETPSRNIAYWNYGDTRDDINWPYRLPSSFTDFYQLTGKEVFAIGQCVNLKKGIVTDFGPGWADIEYLGMALLTADFNCPVSVENTQTIARTLHSSFKTDFAVLKTDLSYHAVIEALLPREHIPWHYGAIIRAFSILEKDNEREISRYIADELQMGYKDLDRLGKVCDFINSHVTPESPTFLDLRWFRRALIEYIESKGSQYFGFLRFSGKEGGKEPVVVAVGGPSQPR